MEQERYVRMALFRDARGSAPHLKAVVHLEHARVVRPFQNRDRSHRAFLEKRNLFARVKNELFAGRDQWNEQSTEQHRALRQRRITENNRPQRNTQTKTRHKEETENRRSKS